MNIREYIESGVLEEYCLGLLPVEDRGAVEQNCLQYPEIRQEKEAIESSLELQAESMATPVPEQLQEQIWNLLENQNKEKKFDLRDLPLINRFSDHQAWLRIVKPLMPLTWEEDRIIQVLRESEKVVQMLVLSRTDFEDEIHRNEHESFIILEGECECTVGNHVFRLSAGGFTEIPLHTSHDVRITSGHVVAILQRIAV